MCIRLYYLITLTKFLVSLVIINCNSKETQSAIDFFFFASKMFKEVLSGPITVYEANNVSAEGKREPRTTRFRPLPTTLLVA